MTVTKADIIGELHRLGLRETSSVLVHSSLSSFGHVAGGAAAAAEALIRTVDEGNLMVPTLTGTAQDGPDCPPVFDVRTSPGWTGVIPELIRQDPRAVRSLHPTHSAAVIGRDAEYLTSGHENGESPCDRHSPYYKNALLDGYILLIGVGQNCNTTIHCCEELAEVPYHLQKQVTVMEARNRNGQNVIIRNRLHDWKRPLTDFEYLEPLLVQHGILRRGQAGSAALRLIRARQMIEFCTDLLRRQPDFFMIKKDKE